MRRVLVGSAVGVALAACSSSAPSVITCDLMLIPSGVTVTVPQLQSKHHPDARLYEVTACVEGHCGHTPLLPHVGAARVMLRVSGRGPHQVHVRVTDEKGRAVFTGGGAVAFHRMAGYAPGCGPRFVWWAGVIARGHHRLVPRHH